MSFIDILLIAAGVGYVLVRRVIGDLVEVKGLLVLPVVLTAVGLFLIRDIHPVDLTTIAFIAVGIVLSIVLGLVRGTTVHLGQREGGELWMRYRASTVGLWLLNIAIKGALVPVELIISKDSASAANSAILLSLGLGILAETAVVLVRAMRTDATVVWQRGDNGQPHQTSPAFDRARQYVTSGAGRVDLRKGVRFPTMDRDW